MKIDRDSEDEESFPVNFGVLVPVGETLLGDVDDGNMIVPDPFGFFTFFNRSGMSRLLICSMVRGWMTLDQISDKGNNIVQCTYFASVISQLCGLFRRHGCQQSCGSYFSWISCEDALTMLGYSETKGLDCLTSTSFQICNSCASTLAAQSAAHRSE